MRNGQFVIALFFPVAVHISQSPIYPIAVQTNGKSLTNNTVLHQGNDLPADSIKLPPNSDDPYALVLVDTEPRMMTNLNDVFYYPDSAVKAHLEGIVTLRFQVLKNGTVGKVIVEKGVKPILDQAAIDMIKKCKFKPAIRKNKPITLWTDQAIHFRLPHKR